MKRTEREARAVAAAEQQVDPAAQVALLGVEPTRLPQHDPKYVRAREATVKHLAAVRADPHLRDEEAFAAYAERERDEMRAVEMAKAEAEAQRGPVAREAEARRQHEQREERERAREEARQRERQRHWLGAIGAGATSSSGGGGGFEPPGGVAGRGRATNAANEQKAALARPPPTGYAAVSLGLVCAAVLLGTAAALQRGWVAVRAQVVTTPRVGGVAQPAARREQALGQHWGAFGSAGALWGAREFPVERLCDPLRSAGYCGSARMLRYCAGAVLVLGAAAVYFGLGWCAERALARRGWRRLAEAVSTTPLDAHPRRLLLWVGWLDASALALAVLASASLRGAFEQSNELIDAHVGNKARIYTHARICPWNVAEPVPLAVPPDGPLVDAECHVAEGWGMFVAATGAVLAALGAHGLRYRSETEANWEDWAADWASAISARCGRAATRCSRGLRRRQRRRRVATTVVRVNGNNARNVPRAQSYKIRRAPTTIAVSPTRKGQVAATAGQSKSFKVVKVRPAPNFSVHI
eukprot:g2969.t1